MTSLSVHQEKKLKINVHTSDGLSWHVSVDPTSSIISIIDHIRLEIPENSNVQFKMNNKLLSNYLSFSFQNVNDGSDIILLFVKKKAGKFFSLARQLHSKIQKYNQITESIDREILRIADLSFIHVECSKQAKEIYSKENTQSGGYTERNRSKTDKSVISYPCHISDEPLPFFFNNDDSVYTEF